MRDNRGSYAGWSVKVRAFALASYNHFVACHTTSDFPIWWSELHEICKQDPLVAPQWLMASAYFIYLFMFRLVVYFAILALLLIITVIALKYIGEWREFRHREEEEEGEDSSERSPLMPECKISTTTTYGTCQNDVELGDDISSSSSRKYCSELYNAKICIICYDDLRNCFFVPCGHSATCFTCAHRIFYKENRSCPVCRRFIGKIRRLV